MSLTERFPADQLIADMPQAPALTDDRPENEYYALRSHFAKPKP